MSGIYNYWVKVHHPELTDIPPLESNQKPFYFGGSQVPSSLGSDINDIKGNGIDNSSKMNFKPIKKGKGVQSSNFHKASNIHLPRHIKSI